MLGSFIIFRYWVLVPLAIVEGPLVAIACGVGAATGYLDPFIAYGILVAGDIIPDLMWYGIGRYGAGLKWVARQRSRIQLLRENLPPLEDMWRDHGIITMTSVKLAYGISPAFIVSAGLVRLPLSKFVAYSLTVSTVMLAVLEAIGYGFSEYYTTLKAHVGNAEFFVGICAALVLGGLFFAMKHFRSQLVERTRKQLPAHV
jgi:membrane protein DedA with SNARE-associated domain